MTLFIIYDSGLARKFVGQTDPSDLARLGRGGLSGWVIETDGPDPLTASLRAIGPLGRTTISAEQAGENLRKAFGGKAIERRRQFGNLMARISQGGS